MPLTEIIKNIGWVMSGRVFGLAINIFVLSLLARYAGAEQFGLLSYSITLVSLFTIIATLDLNRIVTGELVIHPENKSRIFGIIVSIRRVTGWLCQIHRWQKSEKSIQIL